MRYIDYDEVWARLPMRAAIDALDTAISEGGIPDAPQRQLVRAGEQQLLMMPCLEGGGGGVKLITIDPANPDRGQPLIDGAFVLFGPPGLRPEALIDGRALTELRTAAVSGLATRYLAQPGSKRLVIFGAGPQARSHLMAMDVVLELDDVRVVSRSSGPAEALADFARELGLRAEVATPDAVKEADVVCTCTTSTTPVFDGDLLTDGVHINAIGSYRPDMQEVDATTVQRSVVVVETRQAVMSEAGDLMVPARNGWNPNRISADLEQLVRLGVGGRTHASNRTLFKSVGAAFEDLVISRAIAG